MLAETCLSTVTLQIDGSRAGLRAEKTDKRGLSSDRKPRAFRRSHRCTGQDRYRQTRREIKETTDRDSPIPYCSNALATEACFQRGQVIENAPTNALVDACLPAPLSRDHQTVSFGCQKKLAGLHDANNA